LSQSRKIYIAIANLEPFTVHASRIDYVQVPGVRAHLSHEVTEVGPSFIGGESGVGDI
jgi:hypothetical protein